MSLPIPLTPALRLEYQTLFSTCQLNSDREAEARSIATHISTARSRYANVATPLSIDWRFLGLVHAMECSLRFDRHLHNGDPLTARTTHVPANRPATGTPPFTWEASATDALTGQALDRVKDWSLPSFLYQLERYNGFGYRAHSPTIHSPYLWAGSNHYIKGKYGSDGHFNPDLVSRQVGAVVILRCLNLITIASPAIATTT